MQALKKSHYTIIGNSLNDKKDRIIFSTRTSEALLIEESTFINFENGDFDKLNQNVFEKLRKHKFLVPIGENELFEIVSENKAEIANDNVMYEVIQPSAMCQLGCDYCGQEHKKINIKEQLYSNILNRYQAKRNLKSFKKIYIGWFGGEPLMALKQVRELTNLFKNFCKEYEMDYGAKIVTNGLSLKEDIYKELVEELNIDSIEITLDGTAVYHDKRRYTKEGIETFDIIFNNILKIVNSPYYDRQKVNLSIRCNVDERNSDGVLPLIELLDSHKLQEKISYFYPIGVYSWGGNDAHKKSLTKEEFAEMEIDWMIEMIKRGFPVNLLPGRVKKVCMSVSDSAEMIDAFGNIFNCTEVSYVSAYENTPYKIGNVKNNTIDFPKKDQLSTWNDSLLKNNFPCHTCKMLPVCGGGCPKSWHEDMRACPPNKFNIIDKLSLSYLVSQKGIDQIVDIKEN